MTPPDDLDQLIEAIPEPSRRGSRHDPGRAARGAIRALYAVASAGGRVSDTDLAVAGIPERHWPAIREHADRIRELRHGGDHHGARTLAADHAAATLAALGDWEPPTPPGPNIDEMTDDEFRRWLAAAIPR